MAAPDEEHLDDLDGQIERVREQAEDDGILPDDDPKPTFADPDSDGDIEPPNVIGL